MALDTLTASLVCWAIEHIELNGCKWFYGCALKWNWGRKIQIFSSVQFNIKDNTNSKVLIWLTALNRLGCYQNEIMCLKASIPVPGIEEALNKCSFLCFNKFPHLLLPSPGAWDLKLLDPHIYMCLKYCREDFVCICRSFKYSISCFFKSL